MHPFRFGVQLSFAPAGRRWLELAQRAESIGYDVLVMPDHLGRQLSPVPALAAAASVTSRIRLSTFVFANDYRHPLMLAREAATLDVISGGRFEMGLGAGWMISDYRQLGLPYDRAGLRIDRLEESIPLYKALLSGEKVTHHGRHYRLDRASAGVTTIQRPRPPLAIGGGLPRMLRLAAREADIVGILPGFSEHGRPLVGEASERALASKVAVVREAAGSRFPQLEINLWLGLAGIVGSGNSALGSLLAASAWAGTALYGSPFILHGSLPSIREKLLHRRDALGISYYTIPARSMEAMAPVVQALSGK